jgi:hypothetical protein
MKKSLKLRRLRESPILVNVLDGLEVDEHLTDVLVAAGQLARGQPTGPQTIAYEQRQVGVGPVHAAFALAQLGHRRTQHIARLPKQAIYKAAHILEQRLVPLRHPSRGRRSR